ncbi:MAG: GNAT family N-acetyltransferase [Pseudomonadota bacterium]
MTGAFDIRPAREPDLAAIIEIEAPLFDASSWGRRGFESALNDPLTQVFVASANNRPVGFIVWRQAPTDTRQNGTGNGSENGTKNDNENDTEDDTEDDTGDEMVIEAELLSVGVDKKAQRKGIARQLCRFMLTRLGQSGADKVFLEVARNNTAATSLYLSLGFSTVGLRKRYYRNGEDAVLMAKQL